MQGLLRRRRHRDAPGDRHPRRRRGRALRDRRGEAQPLPDGRLDRPPGAADPFCNAMEILLTGEQFSAAEALRIGLINKVVPAAQVMSEARRYAEIICQNGPLAVQAVKRSVLAGLGVPTEKALEQELEFGIPVSMSEDSREGTRAFKEKRKPVFKGR